MIKKVSAMIAGRTRIRCLMVWAAKAEFDTRKTIILPLFVHRTMYSLSMWGLRFRLLHGICDRLIHRVPMWIRFEMA